MAHFKDPARSQQFRDRDIEEAIDNAVSNIVEQVLWQLSEEPDLPRDRALELIHECDGDETAAMHLTLEQKFEVIEEGADDHGYGDLEFRLGNLRSDFESYAVMFIHCIAEGLAREMFEELFDFMDEHDLELEQRRDADNFGWHPHRSERDEGPLCTVFEHRNVEEPGNHVDVVNGSLKPSFSGAEPRFWTSRRRARARADPYRCVSRRRRLRG